LPIQKGKILYTKKEKYYIQKHFLQRMLHDAIQSILIPIARGLLEEKIAYPPTIVYILRLCGFA
jgi:hypothetical protein